MLTRSRARMAPEENRSESPEFEINNQLGLASAESVDTSMEDNVVLSSLRARGQQDETPSTDINTILDFMKQQATEIKQYITEQKQQVEELKQYVIEQKQEQERQSELADKRHEEIKNEHKKLEEKIMGIFDARIKEMNQNMQQRIDNIDRRFKEQDTRINNRLDNMEKRNENEIQNINKKLDKYAKESKEQNERNKSDLQEVINAAQENHNSKMQQWKNR